MRPVGRRAILSGAGLALAGCAAPIPPAGSGDTGGAQVLLEASAAAHGMAAFTGIRDISVAYAGRFRSLVGRLQPVLVDEGHRGQSEERLLVPDGIIAQAHTGGQGAKYVFRRGAPGTVQVWFDGREAADRDQRDAAALVADGYALFLLGPMLLVGPWAGRVRGMERLAPEVIEQDTASDQCDRLRVTLAPGVGLSKGDEIILYMDRDSRLTRRVRFTLEGLDGTRGAVAEVDTMDHVAYAGVRWPTRFHEHLLRPVPIPVHDWRLTGLDLNRGLTPEMVAGPTFLGRAAVPATGWRAG